MKSLRLQLIIAVCALLGFCLPASATTLTFGGTISDTIGTAGQTNSYTFNASAGDVVDLTMTATSGSLDPKIQLYNSVGTLIATANVNFCDAGPVEMNTVMLAAGGTYTVVTSDCGATNTGNYELYLQRTNNPGGATALTFNQATAGMIGTAAQSNTYTFTATANSVVDFTMTATSGGLDPKIRLYNPNGTLNKSASVNFCDAGPTEMDTVTLPTTGTYTVLVGDCADTNTGNYEFYGQMTYDATTPVGLLFNQTQTGTIAEAAQSNTYTFSANANDVIDITMTATKGSLDPKIRLYSPAGALLASDIVNFCDSGPVEMDTVTLPSTGIYTVLVGDCGDTNTGNYAIYSQLTDNPTGASSLTFGQTVSGLIGSAAQSNTYTFSANANDVIDFTMTATNGTLDPKIRLYGPTGALIKSASVNFCDSGPVEMNTVTIPTTGTYTVLVGDCGDTNTGNYEFYSQRTNNPTAATTFIFGGETQAGMISTAAASNTFTFWGAVGNVVDFTMTATSGTLDPKIRLYSPDGSLLGSASVNFCDSGPVSLNSVTLTQTGLHTVLVGDCADTNTGNYNISGQCFNNCPVTPTITWNAPAAITYGTALSGTQLDASASASGSPVAGTFAYTPPSGAVLTAGIQTLSAAFTPTDETAFAPVSASVQLTVNKATPVCTWGMPSPIVYGTALSSSQLDASCSWTVGGVSTPVPGTFAYSPAAGAVLGAGQQTLSVTFTPTDTINYSAPSETTVTLTVNQATLTVTANNASRHYDTANPTFTDSITGFVNGDTQSVVGGKASLTTTATLTSTVGAYPIAAGLGTLTATNYTFNFVNGTLTVTQAKPGITWATPAAITYGTALSSTQLDASSTVEGEFTYAPAAGKVLAGGSHILSVTLTPNDSTDYAIATDTVPLTVNPAAQTITFGPLPTEMYGTAPFGVSATASSELAVSFESTTSTVCTVSGSTVTLVGVGLCTIEATQAGNADYSEAPDVMQSFTVSQGSQTISFAALPGQALGTAPFTLSATASSGLVVSFASTTQTVCTVSGSTVTLVAHGTCMIEATQAGNANYFPASPVTHSFAVSKAPQTISFAALPAQALGAAPFTVSATASSGLAVSFASTTPTVCTVSGSTVTLVNHGTCSIEATQAGNTYFAAATAVTRSFAVSKAPQTILFAALPEQTLGAAPFTVSATASSGLAVSFASTTPTVCTVSGSTVTLVAHGTCSIEATQAGNNYFAAATAVTRSFAVSK